MGKTIKSTVSLGIIDRILLPNILKQEADYKTLIINKDIRGKCELTQDEMKKHSIVFPSTGGIQYDKKAEKATKEISFSEFEKLEIKLALQKLDEDKKLNEAHLSLYNLFVK